MMEPFNINLHPTLLRILKYEPTGGLMGERSNIPSSTPTKLEDFRNSALSRLNKGIDMLNNANNSFEVEAALFFIEQVSSKYREKICHEEHERILKHLPF